MASRKDQWTGAWVAKKIAAHTEVASVTIGGEHLLHIQRRKFQPVIIGTISVDRLTVDELNHVRALFSSDIDFLVNIQREALVDGPVLEVVEDRFGLGEYKDLLRALNEEGLRSYQNPEVSFILRGLSQHSRVSGIDRLNNRLYLVHRRILKSVTVLALNDYEITADVVRAGIATFGKGSVILTSNPNARVTSGGNDAAIACETTILSWKELLGDLHKQWI